MLLLKNLPAQQLLSSFLNILLASQDYSLTLLFTFKQEVKTSKRTNFSLGMLKKFISYHAAFQGPVMPDVKCLKCITRNIYSVHVARKIATTKGLAVLHSVRAMGVITGLVPNK